LVDAMGLQAPQLVQQGLAKLLEDRCAFEVVSGRPPDELRPDVFLEASRQRQSERCATSEPWRGFDRAAVLQTIADRCGMTAETLEQGLFADLKSEQRLIRFKDISPERLLNRYNVALAQAVLLRSTKVTINIRSETAARFRQLLRVTKFHRLVCEVTAIGANAYRLELDGPLSLFVSTQRYGLRLALFLPAILPCRDFDLRAEIRWGPARTPKRFTLASRDGLVSHQPDIGAHVPAELAMFRDLFSKKIADWQIEDAPDIFSLGDNFWIPDFRLIHRATGCTVYLEVLGYWRRASVERHLERLRRHAARPFLLAVSDRLRLDDSDLDGLAAPVHRFRQMPLPDEVARLAGMVS
jgi:predicted nuclease of restriction endonuclease-like RecB superfamily